MDTNIGTLMILALYLFSGAVGSGKGLNTKSHSVASNTWYNVQKKI